MDHTNGRTQKYLEREAEIEALAMRLGERPHIRMPARVARGGRHPMPAPTVTPEQAAACSWLILGRLIDLCNVVSERGCMDDMVVSAAWATARNAIRQASRWHPPAEEQTDGVA